MNEEIKHIEALIERFKKYEKLGDHEETTPTDLKLILLINKMPNCWAARNELEKILCWKKQAIKKTRKRCKEKGNVEGI